MDDRKLSRRQLLKAAGALGVAAAAFDPIQAFADEDQGRGSVTWDIVNLNFVSGSPTHITRGGKAKARSTNSSQTKSTAEITVTGHGTFPNRDKSSKDVTGGGTWKVTTTDAACFPGSGNYRVIELLSWHPAAGKLPATLPDKTGDKGKPSSGLATLRVLYSNGRRGTLTVSCDLPIGAPPCMFEGISASMDYEDFWQAEKPAAGVDGNRTLFHVRDEGDGD